VRVSEDEDDPPSTGRPPPPFIDQGEATHKHATGVFA
jgi:hypothetical protein